MKSERTGVDFPMSGLVLARDSGVSEISTFIENTIHLLKTQCTYRKHNAVIESKIQLSNTRGASRGGGVGGGYFRNTKF